ncbi:MAG: IS5 family transposase [Candidatus Helarchaeota archaeon]
MIKYKSTKQLSIEEFKTPFYYGLDKNNRWARLASKIPWDEFAIVYSKAMCEDFGRPSLDARIVIGTLIIKHKKGLTGEETIEEIKENPYLQYFIGYEEFSHKAPFTPSLFVALRNRLGVKAFDQLSQAFISGVEKVERPEESKKDKDNKGSGGSVSGNSKNQGTLILDASVAPQGIKFPTDLDLLNDVREYTEQVIDKLWEPGEGKRKPRTYCRKARMSYLSIIKKKKKSNKELRRTIRYQLNCINRNIKIIKKMLNAELGKSVGLSQKDLRIFLILQEIFRQQKEMYDDNKHSVSDRIISVAQPYVRPIVRGKSKNKTEFGAKISASLTNGWVFLDHLSWDAFNESSDLPFQVERYKEYFGYYPAKVYADKIYGSHKNRKYLKELCIEFSGKALGRLPNRTKEESRAFRKKRRIQEGIRNGIEGKFGEGKRKYDLIKAKTMSTSESWIAAVFFVMNLAHWQRMSSFLSLLGRLINFKKQWSFRLITVF